MAMALTNATSMEGIYLSCQAAVEQKFSRQTRDSTPFLFQVQIKRVGGWGGGGLMSRKYTKGRPTAGSAYSERVEITATGEQGSASSLK